MTGLDNWLQQATRRLSKDSAAGVRAEIQEHYELSREAALARGSTAAEADRSALAALGDAQAANRQYRRVLLTSAEARVLREGNWEARALCANPPLKWLFRAVPVLALAASVTFYRFGHVVPARALLAGAIVGALVVLAPLLPVYTPSRSRVFRFVKWLVLSGALVLAFGPMVRQFSWLLLCCAWSLIWTEWTRDSIRRKLQVSEWPKQLYL